jgi:hypothetical protein
VADRRAGKGPYVPDEGGGKQPRSRNQDGSWRKKRSDAGTQRGANSVQHLWGAGIYGSITPAGQAAQCQRCNGCQMPTHCERLSGRPAHSVLAMARHDWRQAATLAEQALAIVRAGALEDYMTSALVCAVVARTAAHQGDVPGAREQLGRAVRLRHCSLTPCHIWQSRRCLSSCGSTWRLTNSRGPGRSCGRPMTSCGGALTLAPCHCRPPSYARRPAGTAVGLWVLRRSSGPSYAGLLDA